jgi:hypothetical protein
VSSTYFPWPRAWTFLCQHIQTKCVSVTISDEKRSKIYMCFEQTYNSAGSLWLYKLHWPIWLLFLCLKTGQLQHIYTWCMTHSGLWHFFISYLFPDVLRQHSGYIFNSHNVFMTTSDKTTMLSRNGGKQTASDTASCPRRHLISTAAKTLKLIVFPLEVCSRWFKPPI